MLRMTIAAGALALSALGANAATVAVDGTRVGGNFTIAPGGSGNGVVVAVSDPANQWNLAPTTPFSEWIWDEALVNSIGGNTFGGPVTFLYTFSLAGYKAATASLSGLLSIDDNVIVTLNGTTILSDLDGQSANWNGVQTYGTANGGLFRAALNTLSFTVSNDGRYPAGLRATVEIEASPIPVPAALPLLGTALAAFGALAARRRLRAA